jgi:hypothetical protein
MKIVLTCSYFLLSNAHRQCATAPLKKDEMIKRLEYTKNIAAARLGLDNFEDVPDETLETFNAVYPTYIHVITNSTDNEIASDSVISEQMNILNHGFANSGISFKLEKINRVVQPKWHPLSFMSKESDDMISSLRVGTNSTLNIYFTSILNDEIGWAQYPFYLSEWSKTDGVVIDKDSLPGGSRKNYNLGANLIHETGHWAGLYHTFEGENCEGEGDMVSDTPPALSATVGCPTGKDSCGGDNYLDDVSNYMDYSYDQCMNHFTPGQIKRMRMVLSAYRPPPLDIGLSTNQMLLSPTTTHKKCNRK